MKLGDAGKAIADCDESLIAKPNSTAFSIRGDAWFTLANYDQAIEDFEAAPSVRSDSGRRLPETRNGTPCGREG